MDMDQTMDVDDMCMSACHIYVDDTTCDMPRGGN